MMKRLFLLMILGVTSVLCLNAQTKSLHQLQQEFVDLRCGMFIHFNMPTFFNEDWPDPDAAPELFNPVRMDCKQWAKAAKSANMTYGCLTTKHHSGFCIWDTKTTDYSVMSSPFKRDVVKEYADAFRAEGMKVMLYYSILDTHARLRPKCITPQHIEMIKEQLRELLTNYSEITALIIDGWDAPWSRISYDDVPFEDIYRLVKSAQLSGDGFECSEISCRGFVLHGHQVLRTRSRTAYLERYQPSACLVLPAVTAELVLERKFPDYPCEVSGTNGQ